ncbi:MAG TPA: hypothetical protein VGY13_05950 [Solirubrobacteraceae bacterium]|nr:hypothetical protein [Solirubrobacteraceae bacterium]
MLGTLLALALCGCAGTRTPAASGIPRAVLAQTRPIGAGARFRPPVAGAPDGGCTSSLGSRSAAHVELFARGLVVLVPAGIGARPPLRLADGRVLAAACFGAAVTLEPTGVVLVRPGERVSLGELFRAWGQPLSRTRLASFRASAGASVRAFVNGRAWRGAPARLPLLAHAEIVLELGPYVQPHSSYAFPVDPGSTSSGNERSGRAGSR